MTKIITAGAALAAALATLGLAGPAHAAPVCTSVNKGGTSAARRP
jgi:hypothetical protein